MKTSKIILGGIAGAVVFFFLGWLIYGILLEDFLTENFNSCASRPMEEMIWWAMILSNLAFGFLLAIVFSWSNTRGVMAGAKVAGVIGLLIAISLDFSMYSMSTMFANISALIVDIVAYTFMSVIGGIAIALVMGTGKE